MVQRQHRNFIQRAETRQTTVYKLYEHTFTIDWCCTEVLFWGTLGYHFMILCTSTSLHVRGKNIALFKFICIKIFKTQKICSFYKI